MIPDSLPSISSFRAREGRGDLLYSSPSSLIPKLPARSPFFLLLPPPPSPVFEKKKGKWSPNKNVPAGLPGPDTAGEQPEELEKGGREEGEGGNAGPACYVFGVKTALTEPQHADRKRDLNSALPPVQANHQGQAMVRQKRTCQKPDTKVPALFYSLLSLSCWRKI